MYCLRTVYTCHLCFTTVTTKILLVLFKKGIATYVKVLSATLQPVAGGRQADPLFLFLAIFLPIFNRKMALVTFVSFCS